MISLPNQSQQVIQQANNKYFSTLFEQAKIHYSKNDFAKALEILEQLVKSTNPYQIESYFILANVYHLQGRIGKALPTFKKVLELDPDHTDAMVSLSVILNDIGHYAEAQRFFDLADSKIKKNDQGIVDSHVNKKFSELHDELAQMYATYRRFSEAAEEFGKAIDLDPENLSIQLRLAKMWQKKGDLSGAKEVLLKLRNNHSDYHQASLLLGQIFCSEGRLLEAHREWSRVLAQDPNNIEAKMLLNFAKDVKEISLPPKFSAGN